MDTLIPKPASVNWFGESMSLAPDTRIRVDDTYPALENLASYLAERLRPATGYALPVEVSSERGQHTILLSCRDADRTLGAEGYELELRADGIQLRAPQPAGIFYGIQTLRQLLPPDIESETKQDVPWTLPTGIIRDAPRFEWRGMMLDVSRHFFSAADVKRLIDLIAYYKLNRLHLHLSDDQGWRIEIKSWEQLARIGGSTQVGGGAGGYYTQDEFINLAAYAASRAVMLVPEVDMPGHTNAALASYAELNCDGTARELYTGIEVGFSSLCVDKELTYRFVNDVVREISAISPAPYFHIGGDETRSTPEEQFIRFVERAQEIVMANGKQTVGWGEIGKAQLKPGALAQHWDGDAAALAAAQGAKIIMSPANRTYLDMQYDETSPLGLHWAGYVEVLTAYEWEPTEILAGVDENAIIGVEAPLWSETLTSLSDIEYMLLPRLPGIAEIAWSPRGERDSAAYVARLAEHGKRWTRMGVNYYQSPQVPWT